MERSLSSFCVALCMKKRLYELGALWNRTEIHQLYREFIIDVRVCTSFTTTSSYLGNVMFFSATTLGISFHIL